MHKHFLLKMFFILMKFWWFFDLANANIIWNIRSMRNIVVKDKMYKDRSVVMNMLSMLDLRVVIIDSKIIISLH